MRYISKVFYDFFYNPTLFIFSLYSICFIFILLLIFKYKFIIDKLPKKYDKILCFLIPILISLFISIFGLIFFFYSEYSSRFSYGDPYTFMMVGRKFLEGDNPYIGETPLYGPLFPVIMSVGLIIADNVVTVHAIMAFFYIASVFGITKLSLELFSNYKDTLVVGMITAVHPLLWYSAIAITQEDVIVAFTIIIALYLWILANKSTKDWQRRVSLLPILAGVFVGLFSSVKFIPLLIIPAFIVSKSEIPFANRLKSLISCILTFSCVHVFAYLFYGWKMIENGYLMHANRIGRLSWQRFIEPYVASSYLNLVILTLIISVILIFIMYKKCDIITSTTALITGFYLGVSYLTSPYLVWFAPTFIVFAWMQKIKWKCILMFLSFALIVVGRLWELVAWKSTSWAHTMEGLLSITITILLLILTILVLLSKKFMERRDLANERIY